MSQHSFWPSKYQSTFWIKSKLCELKQPINIQQNLKFYNNHW